MESAASESSSLYESAPRQLRALVVVVAVTASVCLAGHWEFEQVDSGSLGSYVAIDKTSDGSIWVAHGVDVAGLSNGPRQPAVRSLSRIPTIVRNALFLPRPSSRKPT